MVCLHGGSISLPFVCLAVLFFPCFFPDELSSPLHLQFASGGHTQLRGNAIMITSTISVVLFSTVVRCLMPLQLYATHLLILGAMYHSIKLQVL